MISFGRYGFLTSRGKARGYDCRPDAKRPSKIHIALSNHVIVILYYRYNPIAEWKRTHLITPCFGTFLKKNGIWPPPPPPPPPNILISVFWYMSCDYVMWYMSCDICHVIYVMWYMSCDISSNFFAFSLVGLVFPLFLLITVIAISWF